MEAPDPTGPYGHRQRIGLVLGPLLVLAVLALPAPEGLSPAGWRTAGAALWMATWWISEALPIPATALLPLAVFPLLGVGTIQETATPYANPIIFLFLGGFLIATAMQRWGLHRRLALRTIRLMGTGPRALVAGFMTAAAFLSMWVSNTATAVMMLPIGLAVVQVAEQETDADAPPDHFALTLLLGIAYGCNIGGMATLIGTPPNALLAGFMEEQYGRTIGFADWLLVGLPLVAVGLPLTFLLLTRVIYPIRLRHLPGGRALVDKGLARMGRMGTGERWVAVVFVLTALLWIIRPLLQGLVPGLSDAGIAMAGGLVLFLIPVDLSHGTFVHSWDAARRMPWGTLILFGGGLSLAAAFVRTGLSDWIGAALSTLGFLPPVLIVVLVVAVVVMLTEVTSNTATAAAFLPVLAAFAVGIGQDPLLLTIPAVLGASCAFMLPVATPPNAIVYSSGRVPIPRMARAGIVLNLLFIVLITLLAYTLVRLVFHM